jgi:hypothetical protein
MAYTCSWTGRSTHVGFLVCFHVLCSCRSACVCTHAHAYTRTHQSHLHPAHKCIPFVHVAQCLKWKKLCLCTIPKISQNSSEYSHVQAARQAGRQAGRHDFVFLILQSKSAPSQIVMHVHNTLNGGFGQAHGDLLFGKQKDLSAGVQTILMQRFFCMWWHTTFAPLIYKAKVSGYMHVALVSMFV